MTEKVVARAPGRVNLIGEHTDYTGGLALPMAIELEVRVTLTFPKGGEASRLFSLTSDREAGEVRFAVENASMDAGWLSQVEPEWARLPAAVFAAVGDRRSASGTVRSTLPVGAGLASSAALEVALALALGLDGDPLSLARLCRDAERVATGVPCGLMDQLVAIAGVPGSALLVDFASEAFQAVPVPKGLDLIVVDSGQRRQLSSSAYAVRQSELQEAERQIGSLREAEPTDLEQINDPTVRRRARHVVTENQRVLAAAQALKNGDFASLGRIISEGHRSYTSDFEASTKAVDQLTLQLAQQDGVYGARLTGGGFGGCIVAVAENGTFARLERMGIFPGRAWLVTASGGASVSTV